MRGLSDRLGVGEGQSVPPTLGSLPRRVLMEDMLGRGCTGRTDRWTEGGRPARALRRFGWEWGCGSDLGGGRAR